MFLGETGFEPDCPCTHTCIRHNFQGPTRFAETIPSQGVCAVVPTAFGPSSFLQRYRIDNTDPVISVQLTARELRDHVENLIRESTDIENVFTVNRLHRAVRLHVDANQTSRGIALLEHIPLSHHLRAAASTGINPRLVIRNKDHEIALRLALV